MEPPLLPIFLDIRRRAVFPQHARRPAVRWRGEEAGTRRHECYAPRLLRAGIQVAEGRQQVNSTGASGTQVARRRREAIARPALPAKPRRYGYTRAFAALLGESTGEARITGVR